MKREVVWTWSAEADMQRFYAEAENINEGSGLKLLTQVERATALLVHFPRMAPEWHSPVRRLILKRRKLGLFYVTEARGVIVIGVADLRRDPESLWSEIHRRMQ